MNISPALFIAWELAVNEANAAGSKALATTHFILGLSKLPDLPVAAILNEETPYEVRLACEKAALRLKSVFEQAQISPQEFRRRVRYQLREHEKTAQNSDSGDKKPRKKPSADDGLLHRTPSAKKAFARAEELTKESSLEPLHLLRALLETPESPWQEVLAEMLGGDEATTRFFGADGTFEVSNTTPTLDRFGRDLIQLARDGKLPPIVARRAETLRLAQVLAAARKGNALLIGEAGVGKTAVVEGLAQRLAQGNLPPALENKRLIELPLTTLLAGTGYRGEWEARLQAVLREAQECDAILFFDEIHTLLEAGGKGASDAAQIVKPALARGEVRVIGATTPAEYARTIERDNALSRRFEIIWIEEPTREAALEILRGARGHLETHHGVKFSDEALAAAIELSLRFLPDLRLPDKALDALDAAASASRMGTLTLRGGQSGLIEIGRDEIASAIARRARVPIEQVRQSGAARLLNLESQLKHRVVGQDAAVAAVSGALKLAFSGFKTEGRPHGVFLFAGASGSGKTELAKALARALYDDEKSLLRFDMSEYAEAHTVARLLGSPPGYVGHDEGGQLSKAVRARPASVILFDEIEKAHPDVWNLWLQIFDEGHLTDAQGKRVDFSETIIILTSNLGAQSPKAAPLGLLANPAKARDDFENRVQNAINSALRPELRGRIGEILIFPPLSPDAIRRVAEKALQNVQTNAQKRGVALTWDDSVLDFLARQGYDEITGARNMRRVVEKQVAAPLAEMILNKSSEKNFQIRIFAIETAIQFRVADVEKSTNEHI